MNNRLLRQFVSLLRRELWECNRLFIASPLVLAGLMLVASVWILLQVPADMKQTAIEQVSPYLGGVSPFDLLPFIMASAIPFVVVLYLCALIYLVGALYHDRRDGSILFWQSLPVSNLATVLSKVVTVCLLAPLFTAAAGGALILFSMVTVWFLGNSFDVEIAGLWSLLGAGVYSTLLVYLTCVLGALWLFPTIGWILLFSAYVRSLPYLWIFGAFILLLFLEDFVFGTQFLGNWVQSRTSNYSYIVFSVGDFFQRLFSYDMLIGIALGSLLIAGAVNMRRFTD